jgi:hypothetical protein
MNDVRNMLNDFNIPESLRQPIVNAINEAEESGEYYIITPLTTLLVLLDQGYDSNSAVNIYMSHPFTQRSTTRRFFLNMGEI